MSCTCELKGKRFVPLSRVHSTVLLSVWGKNDATRSQESPRPRAAPTFDADNWHGRVYTRPVQCGPDEQFKDEPQNVHPNFGRSKDEHDHGHLLQPGQTSQSVGRVLYRVSWCRQDDEGIGEQRDDLMRDGCWRAPCAPAQPTLSQSSAEHRADGDCDGGAALAQPLHRSPRREKESWSEGRGASEGTGYSVCMTSAAKQAVPGTMGLSTGEDFVTSICAAAEQSATGISGSVC